MATSTLRDAAQVTYRQVDHWVDRGWLRSARTASGPGNWHRWSSTDCVRAAVLREIVASGANRNRHYPDRVMVNLTDDQLERAELLVIEPYVAMIDAAAVIDLLAAHPLVTCLPLASIRRRVYARLPAEAVA